jgi:hypothetical protein
MSGLIEWRKVLDHNTETAQHSVPRDHRDNAPDPRQRATGTAVRGDGVRVFTCACGKVQAGTLRGLEWVPSKWRYLIPPTSPHHPHQGAPQGC